MNGYRFYKTLQMILFCLLGVLGVIAVLISLICQEISQEKYFRRHYGENWRAEYEQTHGPLGEAHAKIALAAAGIIGVIAIVVWLYQSVKNGGSRALISRKGAKKTARSNFERVARARRNMIAGLFFGITGILIGILLVHFRWGIFADHANEMALGVFVFFGGYMAVIAGCWWWLKAKNWTEAVVFIGLMPLAVFFIPFVRLYFLQNLDLVIIGMIIMPLILMVVVFVLPDKSGVSRPSLRFQNRNDNR